MPCYKLRSARFVPYTHFDARLSGTACSAFYILHSTVGVNKAKDFFQVNKTLLYMLKSIKCIPSERGLYSERMLAA